MTMRFARASQLIIPLALLLPVVLAGAPWERTAMTATSMRFGTAARAFVSAPQPICSDMSKVASHPGMMWSGVPTFRDVFPSPTQAFEVQQCCELAGGVVRSKKFSVVKYKDHSKSHPNQPAYLCAAYDDNAVLVKGNSSILAGLSSSALPPAPPGPPKPNCHFSTAQACIAGGGATQCFWYDGACSYRTPASLDCVTIRTLPYSPGNVCVSMTVFDSNPFTNGAAQLLHPDHGLVLGNFNWSSGQLNQYTQVTKMPPQIVAPDGAVHWWSVGSGLSHDGSIEPFDATLTYEEIVDGRETHSTGFSYRLSGKADFGLDLSGPGFAGKVTGQTVGVDTAYATAFNMVFWPNVTDDSSGSNGSGSGSSGSITKDDGKTFTLAQIAQEALFGRAASAEFKCKDGSCDLESRHCLRNNAPWAPTGCCKTDAYLYSDEQPALWRCCPDNAPVAVPASQAPWICTTSSFRR